MTVNDKADLDRCTNLVWAHSNVKDLFNNKENRGGSMNAFQAKYVISEFGKHDKATTKALENNGGPQRAKQDMNAFANPERYKDKDDGFAMMNSDDWKKAEIPSIGDYCSARGLAKLAAYMANKGTLNGDQLMTEETWNQLHADPRNVTEFSGIQTIFTRGGMCYFSKAQTKDPASYMTRRIVQDKDGFYGWNGFGGSVFMWNPELKIGFSYVPTNMLFVDFSARGGRFQQIVIDYVKS